LASKECFNRVGIVIQVKEKKEIEQSSSSSSSSGKCGCTKKKDCKCYVKVPFIFSVGYNGCVSLTKLSTLAKDKTIRKMAVRPIKPTCTKCTDRKRLKQLWCVIKAFLKQNVSFEKDGSAVMRNLFNMDVSNPNFESYSDTKLIYTVLYKAALLNDKGCCESSSPSCSSSETSGRTTSRLTCESKPCESKCCDSSSDCSKCTVDCFQASQSTIKDFLYSTADCGCLDLRWFSSLVPVYTECGCRGVDEAVDEAFRAQSKRLIKDLRSIAGCWLSGRDVPCCNQCRDCNGRADPNYKNGSNDCGCGKKADSCNSSAECKVSKECVAEALHNLDVLYTYLSGVNYGNVPTPIPTTLNGNDLTALFNQIRGTIQQSVCAKLDPYQISSTYTYPPTGGIVVNFTLPTPPSPPTPDCHSSDVAERLINQFGVSANPLSKLLGQ
jgi:hypothetical protein